MNKVFEHFGFLSDAWTSELALVWAINVSLETGTQDGHELSLVGLY